MSGWPRRRLDWLVHEKRRTVAPSNLGVHEVFHYSIPAFDTHRDGLLEQVADIGSAKLLLTGGEVLISKLNPRIPRVLLAESHEMPTVASTEFIALKPSAEVEPRFLAYWLGSDYLRQRLDSATMSVTRSQQRVRPETLTKMWVDIPDLSTQRSIAEYLDIETARIDAIIRLKLKLSAELDNRWRSELLSSLAMRPSIGADEAAWLPQPLPTGWQVAKLRRLLSAVWGGDWGFEPGTTHTKLPCVRAADFDYQRLVAYGGVERSFHRTAVRNRSLSRGDLVIEKSGGGEDVPVGRVVAWSSDQHGVPTNFAGGMRVSDDMDPAFTLLVFRAAYEIGLPWRSIKQTTGLQNLDVTHYLTHRWPIPPIEEQVNIAMRLMRLLERTREVQALLWTQREQLAEHRRTLVTAAVTNELPMRSAA